jgi:uncharacterized membrane protein YfcA
MKTVLFLALGCCAAWFIFLWSRAIFFQLRSRPVAGFKKLDGAMPRPLDLLIGFLANFFDTLGIGSFATTSAALKLRNAIADEILPGTLNVGHCLPTVVQAFIFIAIVQVDVMTLTSMIVASVLGAWLGAGFVSKLPRRAIQISLGVALLCAAMLMLGTQMQLLPAGGMATGLNSTELMIGIVGNFILGALMTLGIGLYAPCMILVSLLGMDPHAAFPIMMGSCAFLMPVGGIRFVRSGRYSVPVSLGLAVGGVPGVLIAAFLVKSLPLDAVRWLVVIVVIYTSGVLLRSARATTT